VRVQSTGRAIREEPEVRRTWNVREKERGLARSAEKNRSKKRAVRWRPGTLQGDEISGTQIRSFVVVVVVSRSANLPGMSLDRWTALAGPGSARARARADSERLSAGEICKSGTDRCRTREPEREAERKDSPRSARGG